MQANHSDQALLDLLKEDADKGIELLFRQYYSYLCKTIYRILPDSNVAEDLAQDVFLEIWRRKDKLNITISLASYLRRAALNKTLNYLRDRKIKWEDDSQLPLLESPMEGVNQQLEEAELQKVFDAAVDQLPEKCRIVFLLSRVEELSHQEIAAQLGISTKTVENQISKALKHLRSVLVQYLTIWVLLFNFCLH